MSTVTSAVPNPGRGRKVATLRLRLLGAAALLLGHLFLVEVSLVAGLEGRFWWGIDARPDGQGRQAITWVEPNGPAHDLGLAVGDVIIGLDAAGHPASLERLNGSQTLHVVARGTSRVDALSWPERLASRQIGTLTAAGISLFFALAAALVTIRATSRRQAILFAVLCMSAAVALAAMPAGFLGQPWAVRAIFALVAVVPTAFAGFFLVFPVDRLRAGRAWTWLATGLALPGATVLALYAAVLYFGAAYWLFEWAQKLTYANMILGFGAGLALLLSSYYGERTPRIRQQLEIAVGGTVVGVLPFLVLSVLPKAIAGPAEITLRAQGFIVPPEMTVLGTVLVPLSFSYAILKHQLIQSDIYVRRGVLYLGFTVATLTFYLLTVSLFQALFVQATGRTSTAALVGAALVAALAADPIRRLTHASIERVFFGDIVAYRRLLDTSGLMRDTILSPDQLHPLVVDTVTAGLPITRLGILVADREDADFRLVWDERGRRDDAVTLERGHWAVLWVGSHDRTLLLEEPTSLGTLEDDSPAPVGTRPGATPAGHPRGGPALELSMLVPVRAGGRMIALLALGERSDGEPFSGADLEFIESIAARYGVPLEAALLHEAIRRQADTDPLTGVYNHRYLLARLCTETTAARETGQPLAVLMMDVDSFKFFNDTYGHTTGDQVLIATTRALQSVCRAGDVFGRYGGDEFVAILPNTDRESAKVVAGGFSAAAHRLTFETDGSGPISLGVSVGVAVMPEDGDTPLQLISAADVAMYQQKRAEVPAAGTLPDLVDLPSPALRALMTAIEQKDGFVAAHCERAAHWAVRLAVALGLPEREQQILRIAGLLHDVGKLGIPDRILNKVDRLTSEEREAIGDHVELGVRLINDVPYEREVIEAVLTHHERWDGQGYPGGLKGLSIPLRGRILSVADVYSAMTTDRPYRPRLTQEEAISRLRQEAGTQLDSHLVEVFLAVLATGDGIVLHTNGAVRR